MMSEPMPLTIENGQFFKKHFLELLEEKGNASFDLSDITDIDLAGIQILVALIHECAAKKKEIHFTGTLVPDVRARLQLAGFSEEFCDSGERFEQAIKAASR